MRRKNRSGRFSMKQWITWMIMVVRFQVANVYSQRNFAALEWIKPRNCWEQSKNQREWSPVSTSWTGRKASQRLAVQWNYFLKTVMTKDQINLTENWCECIWITLKCLETAITSRTRWWVYPIQSNRREWPKSIQHKRQSWIQTRPHIQSAIANPYSKWNRPLLFGSNNFFLQSPKMKQTISSSYSLPTPQENRQILYTQSRRVYELSEMYPRKIRPKVFAMPIVASM